MLVDETRTGISRDMFLSGMIAQKIGVGVHYESIPEHPFYQRSCGWDPEEYPHAARVGRQTVSLPLTSRMTDQDVDDVIEAIAVVLKNDRE